MLPRVHSAQVPWCRLRCNLLASPVSPQVVIKRRQPGGGEDPGGDGGLVLEGALSPDYYKIREVVYAQYHIC